MDLKAAIMCVATSLVTSQILRALCWEIIMHAIYSPDLAASDYYLFLSVANELGNIKLACPISYEFTDLRFAVQELGEICLRYETR